jgi:IPT/TIG domain
MVTVDSLSPVAGPQSGGTTVTLTGSDFTAFLPQSAARLSCRWESVVHSVILTTPAAVVSPSTVKCDSPPMTSAWRVTLTLAVDTGALLTAETLYYTYIEQAAVTAVQPAHGPAAGGTQLTLHGDGFTASNSSELALVCLFTVSDGTSSSSTESPAVLHTTKANNSSSSSATTSAVCNTPPLQQLLSTSAAATTDTAVLITVELSVAGSVSGGVHLGVPFWYRPLLQIVQFEPRFGLEAGSTQVVISGKQFSGSSEGLQCRFGSVTVPAQRLTAQSVTCATPPYSAVHAGLIKAAAAAVVPFDGIVQLAVTDNGQQFVAAGQYTYVPQATVSAMTPTGGTVSGGTVVTLTGTGLSGASAQLASHFGESLCMFGDVSVPAQVLNSTAVQCAAPAALQLDGSSAAVAVSFVPYSGGSGSELLLAAAAAEQLYTYYSAPVVVSSEPATGVVAADAATVQLQGQGFAAFADGAVVCKLGAAVYAGLLVDDTTVQCAISCAESGAQQLLVSLNGGADFIQSGPLFKCLALPAVSSIVPVSGPESGGTVVTVTGTGFTPSSTLCRVGKAAPVAANWLSATAVECTTQAAAAGSTAAIAVSTDGGVHYSTVTASSSFAYLPAVTLTNAAPRQITSEQGSSVTLYGTNFVNSTLLACAIGGVRAQAEFVSSSELLCFVPYIVPLGELQLAVTNNGQQFEGSSSTVTVTVRQQVQVSGLFPAHSAVGSTDTAVQVHGAGFSDAPAGSVLCRFSDYSTAGAVVTVPAQYASDSVVTCSAPPSDTAKAVAVSVSFDAGETFASKTAAVFYYVSVPQLSSLKPATGPEHGGTVVTLVGSGFARAYSYACEFATTGDEQATVVTATFLSSTSVACVAPASAPGAVAVHLSVQYGSSSSSAVRMASALQFSYAPAVLLSSLHPEQGAAAGGTAVTIAGSNFVLTAPMWCRFGAAVVQAAVLSNTLLSCTAPALSVRDAAQSSSAVAVSVSANGADYSGALQFSYVTALEVTAVTPAFGPLSGGTEVVITGSNLPASSDVQCQFVPVNSSSSDTVSSTFAYALSGGRLACKTPAAAVGVTDTFNRVRLHLSHGGSPFVPTQQYFSYVPDMTVAAVYPATVFEGDTGAVLTVAGNGFLDVPTLACRIGVYTVRALWLDARTLQCPLSMLELLPVTLHQRFQVSVTANGVDFELSNGSFSVRPRVSIKSVQPQLGPATGATDITVLGQQLLLCILARVLHVCKHRVTVLYTSLEIYVCSISAVNVQHISYNSLSSGASNE